MWRYFSWTILYVVQLPIIVEVAESIQPYDATMVAKDGPATCNAQAGGAALNEAKAVHLTMGTKQAVQL